MSTRKMLLAPVRAINPENLKAILDFLLSILPIIFSLFVPKPANAFFPKREETVQLFSARFLQIVNDGDLSDEETSHFATVFDEMLTAYVHVTRFNESAASG
jgi:hypothetical protein